MARWSFLYAILIPHLVSGEITPKYGVYGKMLHLNPGNTRHLDSILWKHNGNKVVEFNGQEQEVFSQFRNRVDLDWISAELNITGLRFEDSGEYELEMVKDKQVDILKYKVLVVGKISKPKISCDINNDNSGPHGTQATLTCSADSQTPVTYEWDSDGKMRQGPKLTISLGEKHDDQTYTCTVSNPLDSERVKFTAKDCHPAHSILPVALGAGIAALILVVLLAVLLVCLKQKKKACFAEGNRKDIEASRGKMTMNEECENLLNRTDTRPSDQRLEHLNGGHGNKTGHQMEKREEPVIDEQLPVKVPAGHVKGLRKFYEEPADNWKNKKKNPDDAEADEHIGKLPENKVQEHEPSDTEEATEPYPAGGSDHGEDTQTHVESSAASEQPEKNKSPPPVVKKPVRPLGDKDYAEADDSIGETPQENMAPEFEPSDKKPNEPVPAGGSDHGEETKTDVESSAEKEKKPRPLIARKPTVQNKACKPSDTEKLNEPEPAGESDHGEETTTDVESSTAPELPEKKPRPPIARKPTVQNKACQPSDTEKLNEPEPTGESDHGEETTTDVESSTAPKQPEEPLDKDKTTCSPTPPKKPARQIPVNQPVNNSDAEKESKAPQENKVSEREPSDTEKANEAEPAGGSEHSEDERADTPVAPQRDYVIRLSRRFDKKAGYVKRDSTRFGKQAGSEKKHTTTVSQPPPENQVTEGEPSNTEKENEPDPAVGSDHIEDKQNS